MKQYFTHIIGHCKNQHEGVLALPEIHSALRMSARSRCFCSFLADKSTSLSNSTPSVFIKAVLKCRKTITKVITPTNKTAR